MKIKKIPQRRCVGCGEMKAKKELIRVVADAEGHIHLDKTGKAPGRGAYLCDSPDCLSKAYESRGLERSLKRAIPAEVYESLREEKE